MSETTDPRVELATAAENASPENRAQHVAAVATSHTNTRVEAKKDTHVTNQNGIQKTTDHYYVVVHGTDDAAQLMAAAIADALDNHVNESKDGDRLWVTAHTD